MAWLCCFEYSFNFRTFYSSFATKYSYNFTHLTKMRGDYWSNNRDSQIHELPILILAKVMLIRDAMVHFSIYAGVLEN
ncbi:hypothetical protein LOKO_01757 [Halomonas chromatireducens]|uniref:Uncharacterized protein n=1 Tax=Halomonas chromatireducens TaxID=507626 RepID=A0A0X8HDU8_9GAMM|nr:hypothetical protein LOKO_01757 [Halomonas chromatireducens]